MKWIPSSSTLELTNRNVTALLDKLDDPLSARSLVSPCRFLQVTAVATPGAAESVIAPGTLPLTKAQLETLRTEGQTLRVGAVTVVSVPDAAHYANRPAGRVFMPSSGEIR